MGRGTGRKRRLEFMEFLREEDPEQFARMEELRRYDPQAYRKRLRRIGREYDRDVRIGGLGVVPLPHPGRETDPAVQVGRPRPPEDRPSGPAVAPPRPAKKRPVAPPKRKT